MDPFHERRLQPDNQQHSDRYESFDRGDCKPD